MKLRTLNPTTRRTSPTKNPGLILLILATVSAAGIARWRMASGIGVSPDSVIYLSAAGQARSQVDCVPLKVVIGTTGTSFDELISEGATGFLVAPSNPKALTEKIISAWKHPGLEEMGSAARKKTLEFSPDRTVGPLLAYHREVLHG